MSSLYRLQLLECMVVQDVLFKSAYIYVLKFKWHLGKPIKSPIRISEFQLRSVFKASLFTSAYIIAVLKASFF